MPRLNSLEWNKLLDEYWTAKDNQEPVSVLALAGKYGVTPAAIYYRLNTKGRTVPDNQDWLKDYLRGMSIGDIAKIHGEAYITIYKRVQKYERDS